MADNTITLVGNLTRDPELRYTTGGRGVASAGLAVSRRFQRNGEWEEETSFFNIVAWGDLGENLAASCGKGTRVIVTGDMRQRSYDDREGNTKSVVELNATGIGPDLRWAQAEVARTERTTAPRQQAGTSGGGALPDEEPF
jgi:single-strand DNA-binding protein